jgi:signal recognition particle subunit SRP54
MAKMGGIKDLLGKMPGMGELIPDDEDPDVAVKRIQGMIDSMTKSERTNPDIIDLSRRRRIAAGSGVEPHEIKQFLNQFDQVRTIMRQIANMSIFERLKMLTGMGKAGMFQPGAMMPKTKIGTGHRKTPKERAEERKKKRKQDKRK